MAQSSTDTALTPVPWHALTDGDFRWLISACQASYAGIGPKHVIESAAKGSVTFLRFRDRGLFVVQTWVHENGVREFIIWAMAGKGILAERKKIYEELKQLARLNGCKFIGGRAVRPGLAKVYETLLEAKPQAVYFAKEL